MAVRLRLLLLLLMVAACTKRTAVVTSSELQGGELYAGTYIREELYFGLSKPNGELVSDSAFIAFTENEIATRLPEGFTILEATGYWRGQNGRTERERSRVLIVHYREADRTKARALADLITIYKRMFAQEAVLRVVIPAKTEIK